MGCDCGIRVETEAEKKVCEKSAELEAPDQVCMFDAGKPLIQETFDSATKRRRGAIRELWGDVRLVMFPGLSTSKSVVGVQIQIWMYIKTETSSVFSFNCIGKKITTLILFTYS